MGQHHSIGSAGSTTANRRWSSLRDEPVPIDYGHRMVHLLHRVESFLYSFQCLCQGEAQMCEIEPVAGRTCQRV